MFTTRFAGIPYQEAPRQRPDRQPAGSEGSLGAGLGSCCEAEALRLIESGRARIRPKDVPVPMRVEGYLIGLCVTAGFLMTGTGIRAWDQPENNAAGPILVFPGLVLFFGAFWWTSNRRRRAVTHLARSGHAEQP
ncbi:hypothetical protein [Streptomyces sp. NPDC060035]|uniref:hypothetical protein n=1 Tax=Streptomyces sp. NPDC060035 TaxID=3347044 RepID=UPI0036A26E88